MWATAAPAQSDELNVIIAATPFHEATAGALGYVIKSSVGESAYVVWSRVIPWIAYSRPAFEILGRVMAHEIGHLLLDDGTHSDIGLMRAKWSGVDLHWKSVGVFFLTAEEQTQIRRRLLRRAANDAQPAPPEAASLDRGSDRDDRYSFLSGCCR